MHGFGYSKSDFESTVTIIGKQIRKNFSDFMATIEKIFNNNSYNKTLISKIILYANICQLQEK